MAEKLADIELTSIDVRNTNGVLNDSPAKLHEESLYVNTRYGKVWVTIQGNKENTPFVTYPDLGLNSQTQFHGFFNFPDNERLMESFCAFHINAPGQEENASPLPSNYAYPSCDQLADTVLDVINHFKLKNIICFGIGMGANILSRFSLHHPNLVNACILMNAVSGKCGWVEWGYQKWNRWYLNSGTYTEFTNNYLLWHHFGYQTWEHNHDLIDTYSSLLSKVNPVNLGHLINSYIGRTDLGIQRSEYDSEPNSKKFNFQCSVLNIIGDHSPHEDDAVETNSRLDPTKSTFVKFSDCGGMILEEQPAKMAEALRHFLQGLGYVPHLSITRHSLANRYSEQAIKQKIQRQQEAYSDSDGLLSSTSHHHIDNDPSVASMTAQLITE